MAAPTRSTKERVLMVPFDGVKLPLERVLDVANAVWRLASGVVGLAVSNQLAVAKHLPATPPPSLWTVARVMNFKMPDFGLFSAMCVWDERPQAMRVRG